MIAQEPVTRVADAQGAWCEDCATALGCQYWPLATSVAMHRRGCPTHLVVLWRFAK